MFGLTGLYLRFAAIGMAGIGTLLGVSLTVRIVTWLVTSSVCRGGGTPSVPAPVNVLSVIVNSSCK